MYDISSWLRLDPNASKMPDVSGLGPALIYGSP
jgi:hypothetical protein